MALPFKSLRVLFPAACGVVLMAYIHKSHNVIVLMYHLVFPAKYRRAVFDDRVDQTLKEICLEIAERYQVKFL